MKYDEIPTNYHSPYMVQVAEKLSILKMTSQERANYSYYQKKLYSDRDELVAAEARGIEQGIEQGIEKGKEEGIAIGVARGVEKEKLLIANKMLKSNSDVKFISSVTGLSTDEILKLKNEL
jgi:predicted transposase/invertase (TIGR01784 family)